MNQFKEPGTVEKQKSTGWPRTSEKEDVERIRQSCIRSPKKSIAHRNVKLGIPKPTIHTVLHNRLWLHADKIQLKQEIKPDDRPKVSNLPLSCLTPLMKTKPSYGAFVFGTREHFMWMGVLINTSAIFGEHGSRMRFTSVFEVHHKWTSGVGFCMIVLLVPSSLVRVPLLGLSFSIYLNSTCFQRLKPSNKKL